jgi:hypothetical protein
MSELGFSLREKLPDRADEGEYKNIHKCIIYLSVLLFSPTRGVLLMKQLPVLRISNEAIFNNLFVLLDSIVNMGITH